LPLFDHGLAAQILLLDSQAYGLIHDRPFMIV
jgi:hypothetical protein